MGLLGSGRVALVRELINIANIDGVAIGRTVCQPHDVHRPFSVFIDIAPTLRDLPGGGGCYEYTNTCLDRLTQPHTQTSIPSPDNDAAEYVYEHTRQAIFDLVGAVVHEQPLLFIVEDVHWSDPVSWAFLRELASRAKSLSVLFVCTSREPWNDAKWGLPPEYVTVHGLSQLTPAAAKLHAVEYASGLDRETEAEFVELVRSYR